MTVTTVEAGAPLERLTGETGFIEQDAPAIPDTSQVNATVLETLPCGVTVNVATPVCPASNVRLEEFVPRLKSGIATLTKTLPLDGA